MKNIHTRNIVLDQIFGECVWKTNIQKNLHFLVRQKTLFEGKLILYKHYRFCWQLVLQTPQEIKKIEIPIPFKIEKYPQENLFYFDYRMNNLPFIPPINKRIRSSFYDQILEIQADGSSPSGLPSMPGNSVSSSLLGMTSTAS
jgi:hypothetical protein